MFKLKRRLAGALTGLALVGGGLVAGAAPAEASTTGSIWFVIGNDNPSSFKCYYKSGSTYKRIDVSRTISRSTRIKCNAAWKARVVLGGTLPGGPIGKNKVVYFSNAPTGTLDTISALKV